MYSRDKIIDTMKEIYSESRTIKPYVVIAQPRRDLNEKAAQNFDGYDGLHIDLMGFSHGYCNIGGEKVDVARNYLIEQTLESGAKYLLFVGEDTVLPYDGFKQLMKTAEENPGAVVTGVYYIKCSDAMIMTRENDWIVIPNVDPGQIIEAWQTGMDAMLIPVELLKKMKEEDPELPFCCIGNNINDEIPFIGEDNFFVHRLHKRGTKLLVNTDVQCLHMDLASGMYTAHPSVDLTKYYTNIKPTRRLTMDDKEFIDQRWVNRLPDGTAYKSIIAHKVEKKETIRFNMGSGNDKLEGYLNVDKNSKEADIIIDVMKMDLPENVTEEILASHLIEHLPQHRAPEIISNWYRTLKPKGKLVVETPHIEELCKDFLQQDDEDRIMTLTCIFGAAAEEKSAETEERGALYPHLWGYTPKTLTDLCKSVGFKDVKILPQTGKHPGKNFRLEAVK